MGDNPASSAHDRQMLAAAECRENAHDALARGATAIDPQVTVAWEGVARAWAALAVEAEVYETLRRNFLDQMSNEALRSAGLAPDHP
jgi:hypothetical protein